MNEWENKYDRETGRKTCLMRKRLQSSPPHWARQRNPWSHSEYLRGCSNLCKSHPSKTWYVIILNNLRCAMFSFLIWFTQLKRRPPQLFLAHCASHWHTLTAISAYCAFCSNTFLTELYPDVRVKPHRMALRVFYQNKIKSVIIICFILAFCSVDTDVYAFIVLVLFRLSSGFWCW